MNGPKDIPVIALSICGKSEVLVADHQSTRTSFRKQPVDHPLYLTAIGFEGDSITHSEHHGGNDKAICCYSADRFDYWKRTLGFALVSSAFGENLTLGGTASREEEVFIGDRYKLGEAIVEVSEPRGPCYIIGIRYNYKKFPVHLQETGYTGFYLRTIVPGRVSPEDTLVHLSSHPERISVDDVNRIRYRDQANTEWLDRLINLPELTLEWREKFAVLRSKL